MPTFNGTPTCCKSNIIFLLHLLNISVFNIGLIPPKELIFRNKYYYVYRQFHRDQFGEY